MRVIKIILSLIALLLGAAAGAAGPLHLSEAVAAFLFAGASYLGTWGFQPFQISAAIAAKLQGLAIVIAAGLTVHGAHIASGAPAGAHAHLAAIVFFWLGIVGTLSGFIGRSYLKPTPPPPPPLA